MVLNFNEGWNNIHFFICMISCRKQRGHLRSSVCSFFFLWDVNILLMHVLIIYQAANSSRIHYVCTIRAVLYQMHHFDFTLYILGGASHTLKAFVTIILNITGLSSHSTVFSSYFWRFWVITAGVSWFKHSGGTAFRGEPDSSFNCREQKGSKKRSMHSH